ncbi:MAG: DUF4097 family beta strand repeat-containing protein [Phycisphaerales bacterium]
MAMRFCAKALLLGMLTLTLFGCTSCICANGYDGNARAKYEKVIPLSAALEPGSSFAASTDDGAITLEGAQTSECRLDASIVVHARTEEKAQELGEQIDVRLEPDGKGLRVKIERPPVVVNAWFSVSLRGSLPAQTDLKLSTSDGAIDVSKITGTVEAGTSDGGIEVRDIEGDTRLRTSDGKIRCERLKAGTLDCRTSDGPIEISDATAGSLTADASDGSITMENVRADAATVRTIDGAIRWRDAVAARIDCHSSDGSIDVEYGPDGPKAPDVSITASEGGVSLVTPPEVSAQVDAATNDGSIHTDLPITIQGKVGKSLRGRIGDGEGRIYLRTGDGSITIR